MQQRASFSLMEGGCRSRAMTDGVDTRDRIRIAGVQMEPRLGQARENVAEVVRMTKAAAAVRADLVVYPECAISGYVFRSRQEALLVAETVPGPSTEELAALCRELNIYMIFGLLEKQDDKLFNAAVFLSPKGIIAKYRKAHLPCLGVDRFVERGDTPFEVYQTPIGNIGLLICYDIMFPECPRVMALLGADILVMPTNFSPRPWGRAEKIVNYVLNTRALENRVHVVAVDRVGTEEGYRFVGKSRIVSALGDTLAEAVTDREEVLYAEVSLAMARQKQSIVIPGEWEVNGIEDRRPELYGEVARLGRSPAGDNK